MSKTFKSDPTKPTIRLRVTDGRELARALNAAIDRYEGDLECFEVEIDPENTFGFEFKITPIMRELPMDLELLK